MLDDRNIIALFHVNEDILRKENEDNEPIDTFEKFVSVGEANGFFLRDSFIADCDESDPKYAYTNYLVAFAFEHLGNGESPLSYEAWMLERRQK